MSATIPRKVKTDARTGRVIIAGAGRAGTSMLVRLLTRLGYDTGYDTGDEHYLPHVRAGCEITAGISFEGTAEELREAWADLPEVIKAPDWSFHLAKVLDWELFEVAHVLIPVRDPIEAAHSRLAAGLPWRCRGRLEDQILINHVALGAVVASCVGYQVPFTLMHFPTLVKDWRYCRRQLARAFPDIATNRAFRRTFEELNA